MAYTVETKCLHQEASDNIEKAYGAISFPIYQTATFAHRGVGESTGYDYSRLQNPTREQLEKTVASLEKGIDAIAFSSGMSAIAAVMELFRPGDHVIADADLYGGSVRLFQKISEKNGITFSRADLSSEDVQQYLTENTKAIYIETLGNPNSDVVDIETIANLAHEYKIPLVVDNTFATPYLVRPIEYGADIVVHSATKFIGGHGTSIGGVIIDSGKFDWEASGKFASLTEPNPSYHGISFTKAVGAAAFVTKIRAILLRDTGATISPFNSFLFLQGLETLSLRVERHVQNALKVDSRISE